MKTTIIALALFSCAQAFATSALKKPLPELVAEADYILIGKIMKRAMYDAAGKEITDPNAFTGQGTNNELRLYVHLDSSGILKSPARKPPADIVITLYRGNIIALGNNRGPESDPRIFLLKATFEELYPRDSIRQITDRVAIEALLKGQKEEPNKN